MKKKIVLWLVALIVTMSISVPLHTTEPLLVQHNTHGSGGY